MPEEIWRHEVDLETGEVQEPESWSRQSQWSELRRLFHDNYSKQLVYDGDDMLIAWPLSNSKIIIIYVRKEVMT